MSGVLSGCQPAAEGGSYAYQTLTGDQVEQVATIAEMIIPTTDTPGARAVGVHEFVDLMLTDWYPDEDRTRFLDGLADVDARSQSAHGKRFLDCSDEERVEVLTELDQAAYSGGGQGGAPFFRMMKELTLTGYYTSEIGATQELQYVHEAGVYRGDVPYSEIGRAYA
jgi:hypothetical protein